MLQPSIFEKILVHEDTGLDPEYAEPFATLLDPSLFMLKGEFERNQEDQDGRPQQAAHLSLSDYLATLKTKTSPKIRRFFGAGLSVVTLLPGTGLEPARSPART